VKRAHYSSPNQDEIFETGTARMKREKQNDKLDLMLRCRRIKPASSGLAQRIVLASRRPQVRNTFAFEKHGAYFLQNKLSQRREKP
jgi:hypothetical protein